MIQQYLFPEDIAASAHDFMLDPDVTVDHKKQIESIIEQKIEEERAEKRAFRQKMRVEKQMMMEENNGTASPSISKSEAVNVPNIDFSLPPPMISSVPMNGPPMVVPAMIPKTPTSEPCISMPSHIIPIAPPVPIVPAFSTLPPVPPPPTHLPTAIAPPQQPQFTEAFGMMSEEQIVQDAIRRGTVAPIPQELLMGASMAQPQMSKIPQIPPPHNQFSNIVNQNFSLEEDMRRLMETERRIEMERRFMMEIDEMEERKKRLREMNGGGEFTPYQMPQHGPNSNPNHAPLGSQLPLVPPVQSQNPPQIPPDMHPKREFFYPIDLDFFML